MEVLRSGLRQYLSVMSTARSCAGVRELCRSHRDVLPHERTIYRWHTRLGSSLVVYPSFFVEALGLSHLFVFVTRGRSCWEWFPYSVETSWVSPDCKARVLFVHAVVPTRDCARLTRLLRKADVLFAWGSTGWEQLALAGCDVPVSRPSWRGGTSRLLRDVPLVVPVVFENWGRRLSLPGVWRAIVDRLGPGVREYVGGRVYQTNGKQHVREALRALVGEGLFRQYVVRYEPLSSDSLRLLVLVSWDRDRVVAFLERVRRDTLLVGVYPTTSGWLLRIDGSPSLLGAIIAARPDRVFFVREEAGPSCRWRYEILFNPRAGSWLYPQEILTRTLGGRS